MGARAEVEEWKRAFAFRPPSTNAPKSAAAERKGGASRSSAKKGGKSVPEERAGCEETGAKSAKCVGGGAGESEGSASHAQRESRVQTA
eukprot:606159-Rhodomonas_salina.1